tara:strand:+ start:82 stop:366 length:285 start_codon:yes stop_codon:yes gene_type:complete
MKITKQRLKEIIKEELEGNTFEMSADELTGLGQTSLRDLDKSLLGFQSAIARLAEQHEGGEFVNLRTHANMLQSKLDDLRERYIIALGNFENRR